MDENTLLKEDIVTKIRKPKMYKVIMHNDDYTTMEFVIEVLISVFKKNPAEATKIMFDVHKKGAGVAGIYSYDIAATKVSQVRKMAKESGHPLRLSMKEE